MILGKYYLLNMNGLDNMTNYVLLAIIFGSIFMIFLELVEVILFKALSKFPPPYVSQLSNYPQNVDLELAPQMFVGGKQVGIEEPKQPLPNNSIVIHF